MKNRSFGITLILSVIATLAVFGQARVATSVSVQQQPPADSANDTLGWWTFTQGTETLYLSPNGGYVFGVNGFNDREKARSFSKDDTSSVDEVLLLFGAKSLNSGNPDSYIRIVAYRPDSVGYGLIGLRVGAPGTEMGSVDLPVSDIDTSGGFTAIDMSSITIDTTNFLISIDLTGLATGDTVGLISTTDGDAGGDETVWERHNNGDWVTLLEPNIGWNLDCHPAIFCVLNAMEVGMIESATSKLMVWPNPAHGEFNVANPTNENIAVRVYSLDSKVMRELIAGNRHNKLDVSSLNPGTYVMQSSSTTGTASQMIIIY